MNFLTLLLLLSFSQNNQSHYIVTGTVYHAVEEQTNSNPTITADMSVIDLERVDELRWVALSRDLLSRWGGEFNYGDTIYVQTQGKELKGKWVARDTMNKRWRNKIDFLVCERSEIYGKWEGLIITKDEKLTTKLTKLTKIKHERN